MQIVSLEFWITLQIVDPDHFFGLRKLSFWFVLLLILQIVPPDQFLSITQIVSLDHIIAKFDPDHLFWIMQIVIVNHT